MAKNQDVFFTKTPQHVAVKFVAGVNNTITDIDGSTGTIQIIATAGADDSIVRNISIISSDTSSRDIMLFISNSATLTTGNSLLGIVNVPLSSGYVSGVVSVNGLNATAMPFLSSDKDGNRVIILKSGWYLKVGLKAALTTSTQITITCTAEDY